jgi:hypothetical protein
MEPQRVSTEQMILEIEKVGTPKQSTPQRQDESTFEGDPLMMNSIEHLNIKDNLSSNTGFLNELKNLRIQREDQELERKAM